MYRKQENSHLGQPDHTDGNQNFDYLGTECLYPKHKIYLFMAVQGEGNGNPLQCSCLENPVDRGAWWSAVHRAAQSQTRLKQLSMHARIGKGSGNALQCSCLENPRDRGAWWAAVQGSPRVGHNCSDLAAMAAWLFNLCYLPYLFLTRNELNWKEDQAYINMPKRESLRRTQEHKRAEYF